MGPFAGSATDGHENFASRSALLGPSTKRRMTGKATAKETSRANGAKERSRKSPRAILIAALSGNAFPHLPHFGLRVMEYAGSRLIALQELQRTSRLFISGVPMIEQREVRQTDENLARVHDQNNDRDMPGSAANALRDALRVRLTFYSQDAATLAHGLRIMPALSGKPSPISTRRRLCHAALAALQSALACPVSSNADRDGGLPLLGGRQVRRERCVFMAAKREPEQADNPL